jgi:hypothetical protein
VKRALGFLAVGSLALVGCIVGFVRAPEQAFGAWLAAFWFWLGLSLGSLSLLLMLRLAGGSWEGAGRPRLAAATHTLPLMALLFLPLIAGLQSLYPWIQPQRLAEDHILREQHAWLNEPGYIARTLVCFAFWIALAKALRKPDCSLAVAGIGALLQLVTVTLASIDGMMSLQPEFHSTAFGLTTTVAQMLGAMALLLLLLPTGMQGRRDAGGVLLMLVLGWTYLRFMDYITAWTGDLPADVAWYLRRAQTNWRWLALTMMLLESIVPFFLLVNRGVRSGPALRPLAAAMLVGNATEVWWRVRPAQNALGVGLGIYDACALVAIGGLWLAVYEFSRGRPSLRADRRQQPAAAAVGGSHG